MGLLRSNVKLNMNWIGFFCLICNYTLIYGNAPDQSNNDFADLLPESANDGVKTKPKGDDDKKTLAQQVAEGRYGLIPSEIFKNPIARPGIISYDGNSEVPKDNIDNLGGLNESDIWLAEKHLLVLRGGVLSIIENEPEYTNPVWPPIDDYKAPKRPVKIPKNPKIPPPFPVQLTENGPLQILGTNFTRTLNESFFPPPYAVSPLEGYDPGSGPFFPPPYPYPSNATAGQAPFPDSPYFTPIQGGNQSGPPFPINGVSPFFESLPPGSAILPPPNITDQDDDEDDLSIYYPPPYTFYYKTDNTSHVPPGPLVPGIVLPPPPDFFTLLHKPSTTSKPATTTPRINVATRNTTTIPTPVYIKPTPPFGTRRPQQSQRNKTLSVTILRPIKTTKKPLPVYVEDNQVSNKPFEVYGPPPPREQPKISIKTTKVPLKAYFSTVLQKDRYTTKSSFRKQKPPPPQIYYYDDSPATNLVTPYPSEPKPHFRNLSAEYFVNPNPRYYLPSEQYLPQTQSNNFKTHILHLQDQLQNYQPRPHVQTPKPVYQYSFEVSNYKEQHEKLHPLYQEPPQKVPKYSVQIEPAVELTTQRPLYQNQPIPIYFQPYQDNRQILPPRYNYQERQPVTSSANLDTYNVTPNPYQPYYTKQDDQILDDITKTYFTTFGKRIRPSTTPLPPPSHANEEVYPRLQPKRPSATDENILVNYINQRDRPRYVEVQPQVAKQVPQFLEAYQSPRQENNYRHKTPQNVQTIQAINLPVRTSIREGQGGSFISYELPGDDGAHFYFLTPQLSNYYAQDSEQRIRQNRETKTE